MLEHDNDPMVGGAVVAKLSESQVLYEARMSNFGQCVRNNSRGPGGVWSNEVLDAILEIVRQDRDVTWPVRPPWMSECGPLLLTPPTGVPVEEPDQFQWAWMRLPIPWLESDGSSGSRFPLPVAKLATPIDGHAYLINATALWHLLPTQSQVAQFFRRGAPFWSFAAKHGLLPDNNMVPGNRGKSLREQAGQPLPQDGTLAARLSFTAYLASPPLMVCSLFWMASVQTQRVEVQKAVHALLDYTVNVGARGEHPRTAVHGK